MTVAMLISLLPLIEAVLKEAPHLVADVQAIIARVRGGTASSVAPEDAAKIMAGLDSELSRFK